MSMLNFYPWKQHSEIKLKKDLLLSKNYSENVFPEDLHFEGHIKETTLDWRNETVVNFVIWKEMKSTRDGKI